MLGDNCTSKVRNENRESTQETVFFIKSENDGTHAPVNEDRSVVNGSNIKSVSEYTALFFKTESQEDVVVKLEIDKINADKTTTVILSLTLKTLKRKMGRGVDGISVQCCILTGRETHYMGLFPTRSKRTVFNTTLGGPKTFKFPQRWKSLVNQDSIQLRIAATMYSCKETHDGQFSEDEALAKDLGAIYGDGNGSSFYPDLVLQSKNGILLKANRIIVAARSPQLKARLEEILL